MRWSRQLRCFDRSRLDLAVDNKSTRYVMLMSRAAGLSDTQ